MVGCILANFLEFSNFFESFHTNMAQNHPQLQILPKKLIRLGQNDQIWLFCTIFYLFPQNEAKIDHLLIFYHPIHNFSHLLPPKHIIFGEISKFSFLGGGGRYISKFFEFSNFFKSFYTNMAENDPQWQIWPKKWLRLSQNGHFCIFFYLFPQNEAEIDCKLSISPDSQLFPSFATKAYHFWRNLKNFCFWGGGTSANFLSRLHSS